MTSYEDVETICADERTRVYHPTSDGWGYVYVNDRGRSKRVYGYRVWLGDSWRFRHAANAKHRHLLLAQSASV